MIRTQFWSDDQLIKVTFDATPWFNGAADDEIQDVIDDGYRGNYGVDNVALGMAHTYHHEGLEEGFRHIIRTSGTDRATGFEVAVNEDDAKAWIAANRPHLKY